MSIRKQDSHETRTLRQLLAHLSLIHGDTAQVTTVWLPRLGIGLMERYLTDFLKIEELCFLRERIQERRREWKIYHTTDECRDFLEKTCRDSVPHTKTHSKFGQLHTSPSLEIASLLNNYKIKAKVSLLPEEGAKIMTSVATAGSWQEGEWPSLATALGLTYEFHVFKTVLVTPGGPRTGRNYHSVPKNDLCIKYDQNTPKDHWSALSENLYTELMEQSRGCAEQDFICHWGCTSHSELKMPNDKGVLEAWAWHEHWNILYCTAMARHALEYLKTGGTLVLKVRIFEEAETLGLMSILACAFEKVFVIPNFHQLCEFAMFCAVGFLGSKDKTVEKVRNSLKTNTSYDLATIFSDELTTNAKFKSTLRLAVDVREEFRCDHDYVAFITLQITYEINKCVQTNSKFPHLQVAQRLQALSDMDSVPVDSEWIADIGQRIDEVIKSIKTNTKTRPLLNDTVTQWQLQKFGV